MMHDDGRAYVLSWLALLGLTGVSYGVDLLDVGPFATLVALAIATLKAGIVLLIFMHLRREPFAIRFVACLNVAWILLLCLGVAADIAGE